MEYEGNPSSLKRQFWILSRLKIKQYGLNTLYEWNGDFEGIILDYMNFEEFFRDGLTT
jgi:hypothetical protein